MFLTNKLADTPILRFYNRYQCKYCAVRFVIMPTETGSALPVEFTGKKPEQDDIFDPTQHVSHLLNCKPAANNWENIKRAMRKSWLNLKKKDDKEALK